MQLKRRLIASCGEIQFLDRAKYSPLLVKTPAREVPKSELKSGIAVSLDGHFLPLIGGLA